MEQFKIGDWVKSAGYYAQVIDESEIIESEDFAFIKFRGLFPYEVCIKFLDGSIDVVDEDYFEKSSYKEVVLIKLEK